MPDEVVVKKQKKTRIVGWQAGCMATIVLALCFSAPSGAVSAEVGSGADAEGQTRSGTAPEDVAALTAELAETRRKLTDLRRRFADLYLASRKLQERAARRDWIAAELLQVDEREADTMAGVYALGAMERHRTQQRELHQAIKAFKETLSAALDALQPTNIVERELLSALDDILAISEELAHSPSPVAGRGGDAAPDDVRVLTVNDALQAVVLDRGRSDGMVHGSSWCTDGDRGESVQLKVVETGEKYSVAVPIEGRLKALGAGMRVVPDSTADSAASDEP